LATFSTPPITALRELIEAGTSLLATIPELDHYGERSGAHYIGPLLGRLRAPRVDWPQGAGRKVFVSIRPDTRHAQLILSALHAIDARVLCVADKFAATQLEKYRKSSIRFTAVPVDLDAVNDADLCITYGAEGTMLRFLSAGVPQLISRWHVETYMSARRIEAVGAGASFADTATEDSARELIVSALYDGKMQAAAMSLAQRLSAFDAEKAIV
jgi:UDP:flavonoid glycosyltransferase YjiC (YdhE family)